jgi:sigma-B regulation protein RsbU (phosphoserine phosphatase)
MSRTARVTLAVVALFAAAAAAAALGVPVPAMGLLRFFFVLAALYWFLRFLGWVRRKMLWSLRNRLLVAYLFIAVVPILLLLTLAGISASILYGQLGSYVLSQEVHRTLGRMNALAEAVLANAGDAASGQQASGRQAGRQGSRDARKEDLVRSASSEAKSALDIPGLEILPGEGRELLPEITGEQRRHFEGLVQDGDKLWLTSVVTQGEGGAERVVSVTVAVTPDLLDRLPLDLGTIRCDLLRVESPEERGRQGVHVTLNADNPGSAYIPLAGISSRRRALPPPAHWLDREITGFSKFEAISRRSPADKPGGKPGGKPGDKPGGKNEKLPVFMAFTARPSQLSRQLFSSLGDLSGLPLYGLLVVTVLFLMIEAAALVTGVVLTRTITTSVNELYTATLRVQSGDLAHRIHNVRSDQLGALAGSFNAMIVSVARAIEEQRRRERLENELSIAREVQTQLFPRVVPRVPGFDLVASCRAARVVSGDYYDFISLGEGQLAFIVADIAGKGISAALLMASLQAALRSQLLDGQHMSSTAGVVARLNQHLLVASADDRYATLFLGIYNSQNRTLRYTNAGHLPPLYFNGGGVTKLETGGTVVGLLEDCVYEEGTMVLEPGSILMAYSDGITEPENVYGEQFGRARLIEEVQRNLGERPEGILEAVVAAVDHWAGSPEQSDDMTVVLASVS